MVGMWITHRHFSPEKKEEISQEDNIIGPMRTNDEIYIYNGGRLWATWDHYPICATREEDAHKKNQRGNKKWTGWKPITVEHSLKFKKR